MADGKPTEEVRVFNTEDYPQSRGMGDWKEMPEYVSTYQKPLFSVDVLFGCELVEIEKSREAKASDDFFRVFTTGDNIDDIKEKEEFEKEYEKARKRARIHVHFESKSDFLKFREQTGLQVIESSEYRLPDNITREAFAQLVDQSITDLTHFIWYPENERLEVAHLRWASTTPQLPQYPVFVPTKGRSESRFTLKALKEIGVPYKAVIEEHEVDNYIAAGEKREDILVLKTHNKGLVVTRNLIWDHAHKLGVKRFWTFDDNIRCFYRLHNNAKIRWADGTMLRVIEDFADRYENIAIAGMHYDFFAKRRDFLPPFLFNTRVYSNMLILTDMPDTDNGNIPFRNEGFYNDDTDLCIRVLKQRWCTFLFYTFLIGKAETMSVKGGMTGHYVGEGRLRMAKELVAKHPTYCHLIKKFGAGGGKDMRDQHCVDYSSFQKNVLKLTEEFNLFPLSTEPNNYGLYLKDIS